MGTDISGYVEISNLGWRNMLNLLDFNWRSYAVYNRLTKFAEEEMPEDILPSVKEEYEEDKIHLPCSEFWPLGKEWPALVDVVSTLAKHFGEKNIRMVFWFTS
jgi:hypothetical protein